MQESLVPFGGRDARVAELLSRAHALALHAAPNTLRSYMADWQDFCEFAASIGVPALPAAPSTVACYLAERAGDLKAATLGRRLSGIAFYHRRDRLDSPTRHPQVRAVLKGIKREYGAAQTFKRALLTPEIRRIVACCPDTLAGMRDRALWLVSYAAMTRRSETAGLRVEDITPSEPQGILLNIRKSKVDAESRSRQVGIPYGEEGYVPLAEVAAELLFQVIAERAEKAAVIVTTNLPFSEWPQVFTNARLCKAVLDRLTDQAHIIETGAESYRFRRTLGKKRKG